MTKYRVTIDIVTEREPDTQGYVRTDVTEVYKQDVEDLDVREVVAVVNGIVLPTQTHKEKTS
jgi:hypothetical protein